MKALSPGGRDFSPAGTGRTKVRPYGEIEITDAMNRYVRIL
jgi:hypothetical protein